MAEWKSQIMADASSRPDLFVWNGPIEGEQLRRWLSENKFNVPEDFITFLELTGGGDLFESETILGPYGDVELGDDLLYRCQHQPPLGRHAGRICCISSRGSSFCDPASDQKYVTLTGSDFQEKGAFSSLEGRYVESLRKEYRELYGLGAISVA